MHVGNPLRGAKVSNRNEEGLGATGYETSRLMNLKLLRALVTPILLAACGGSDGNPQPSDGGVLGHDAAAFDQATICTTGRHAVRFRTLMRKFPETILVDNNVV